MNPAGSTLNLPGRVIDLDAEVLRDAAGAPVPMRPQAWAVLRLLARHAGCVVGKEQLLATVWPGLVVTDGSLAQAISDVRSALGDTQHRVVKTMARRGYLLNATLEASFDAAPASSLPPSPGPLFGRDRDLEQLRGLLARHRLVSTVGAAGIGKTALALAAALAQQEAGARVVWVDLARINDAALLPPTLAQSLALPAVEGGDPMRGLLVALRKLHALVVLDNAEHLIDAVAQVARRMLDAAPALRLLVTSQAPLRIDAERVFRLHTLDVPAPGTPFAHAAGAGSVALFLDCAKAGDHRFELSEDNIDAVVRVCQRLDGLPLAIRLAAARLHLFGITGLESRLNDRLQLLSAGSRDAPTRQQTLQGALDWSCGLLSMQERKLFRTLGVFVGGFTLELACATVAEDRTADDDGPQWTAVSALEQLVERSLVQVDAGNPPRYRLLQSQRDYALHELARHGEGHAARQRHARAVARALAAAGAALWSTPEAEWLARWAPELDNLRGALDWSEQHDVALHFGLIGAAPGLFRMLGLGFELRRRAAAVESRCTDGIDPEVLARYWLARADVQGGVAAGPMHDFAQKAEHLARSLGERQLLYIALCQRLASSLVPSAAAQALLAEVVALESDAWPARCRAQRRLAEFVIHNLEGRRREALRAAEAGFALATEARSALLSATFGNWTVVGLLDLGDTEGATRRIGRIRPQLHGVPADIVIPFVGTCARCALARDDLSGARTLLEQMFELCRTVEWASFEFFAALYVRLAFAEGRLDDAARLLGFADPARERAWGRCRPTRSLEEARSALSATLGADRVARLRAEGERLGREEVCTLVFARRPPCAN